MKKLILTGFLLLLITLASLSVPKASPTATTAKTTEEDLLITPGLPGDIPRESMPDNFTTDGYLNTTNPYSNIIGIQGALDEVDDSEGDNPLYVLVFGDEEERNVLRRFPGDRWPVRKWDTWAKFQIERGDEALISNFDVDIRILGFLEWDSNDSETSMLGLWDELWADTSQYLGQWYEGEWWSNYVDAIIGITSQTTPGESIAGLAPGDEFKDQGKIFILLKWQVYWADDNLVQHEISHLFYVPDHYYDCCVMAYHNHFQLFISEDGLWFVFADIPCIFTAYSWHATCYDLLDGYKSLYLNEYYPYMLVVRHDIPAEPRGSLSHLSTTYLFNIPIEETISVVSTNSECQFAYWLVDGQEKIYDETITISVHKKRVVAAYFYKKDCLVTFFPVNESYDTRSNLEIAVILVEITKITYCGPHIVNCSQPIRIPVRCVR